MEIPSTPVESLVKKLTAERIIELKKNIADDQQEYSKLKGDLMFLQSSSMDESRLREMWAEIEQEKIQKEREQVRYDQWLKEREEKKLEIERQWRPNYGMNKSNILKTQKSATEGLEADSSTPPPGTPTTPSPLLTSLLKSSQANQSPITPSNTARSAPTITNLLTGSPSTSSSSNSPLITQSSTNAQNNLINASVSVVLAPNANINHSASSSVQIPVSQSAPTLITLLDKKVAQDPSTNEKQQLMMAISVPDSSGGKDGDGKDDDADLLAGFNFKLDDEDLEDINSIIMNPDILEDKIMEDEPIKDVDDSSQATSTDDYDKLKIKQLVEDFAGVPDVESSPAVQVDSQELVSVRSAIVGDTEIIQVPSEPENSNPASDEMVGPTESNDSKVESPTPDDKVLIISDESSTNDEKKEGKADAGEGEESQSVKSSTADDIKEASGEDSNKEMRAFKGIQESNENSVSSEKESKEPAAVYQVDDSDEDILFEDAEEHQEDSSKIEKETDDKTIEKIPDGKEAKAAKSEIEEVIRSAGSVDSDDEVLEVKVSRSTGRKKAVESVKPDAPSSSTRPRDHSENDDKDSTPIRTRSRHSSTITSSEPRSSFNFSKEQDHSMWKARWDDCQKELQKLKDYSSIVDNKVIHDDSYKTIILQPINMKLIQKNIENHVSTMPGDVKRDFALMCSNIIMLNKKGSKFNEMVHQFIKDGMEIIDSNLDVEDVHKSYREQIRKKN